ncbi:MAG: DUF748 domain-containing protein [Candidatus Omnitrophota bacterium]
MKPIVKPILIAAGIILVIVIIIHFGLFAFINTKGKDFIIGELKSNLGLEAAIESLSLKFPFNLEIKDFQSEDLSFKRANISLGFYNPFTSHLSLNKVYLDGLKLKITKDKRRIQLNSYAFNDKFKVSQGENLPANNPGAGISQPGSDSREPLGHNSEEAEPKLKEKRFSLAVGNFYLKNSSLDLTHLINKRPVNVIFDNIDLRLKGFTYPKTSKFDLKLNASLGLPLTESKGANGLAVKGWVDYDNKNMDLVVNIDSLDYLIFGRYCPSSWQPDNLKLKAAIISFEAKLNSQDNNLTIDNLLTIEEAEFFEKEEGQEEFSQAKTLRTIISYLKGNKEKPTFRFKLITKMDSPKLDFSALIKSLIKTAQIGPLTIVGEIIGEVKERIKGAGGATIGNIIETFKGAADTIEASLKTEEGGEVQEGPKGE